MILGRRAGQRRALQMSAFSAIRANPVLSADGKPGKVAQIAAMRKLLRTLGSPGARTRHLLQQGFAVNSSGRNGGEIWADIRCRSADPASRVGLI
jgi:hypothetical protein